MVDTVKTKNISIRGVGEAVWRNFKSVVVKEDLNIGETTTEALALYLKRKKEQKPRYRFLDLEPVDFGPGTEDLSERIDEVLYGMEE